MSRALEGVRSCFLPVSIISSNDPKFHYKNESDIDISCLQDEIATLPCPFIKRAEWPAM